MQPLTKDWPALFPLNDGGMEQGLAPWEKTHTQAAAKAQLRAGR